MNTVEILTDMFRGMNPAELQPEPEQKKPTVEQMFRDFKTFFVEESNETDAGNLQVSYTYTAIDGTDSHDDLRSGYPHSFPTREIKNIEITNLQTFDDNGDEFTLPDKDLEDLKALITGHIRENA